MAKTRRAYEGAGASTTLNGAFAAGATTFSIAAATGWPYGANPFFIVVEPGTANEEKILVTRTNSGDLTLTVSGSRGADGTTDVTHADGSTVYPVFTATDADEANELASTWTTKGDIVTHGASTFERLAVGTDGYLLTADSTASGGISWGVIDTDQIATNAVTADKIAADSVTGSELASNSVAATHIVDGSVGTAELAADAVNGDKIADDSIDSEHYVDRSIDSAHIALNAVTVSEIEDVAAHSILARVGSTTGDLSELTAGTDTVLRRDGSGNLAFGTIDGNHIASNAVTVDKIEDVAGHGILARVGGTTGDLSELTAGADTVLRRDGTGNLAFGTIDGNHIGNDTIALGTKTTGNYVATVSGSTGISVSGGTGEGSTPTVSIDSTVLTTGSTDQSKSGKLTLTENSIGADWSTCPLVVNANNGAGIALRTGNSGTSTIQLRAGSSGGTWAALNLTGPTGSGAGLAFADIYVHDVYYSGTLTPTSSETVKHDIVTLADGALARVNTLRPVTFRYNDNPERLQAGFIAEEVDTVIPVAVTDHNGVPGIDPVAILSSAVAAIQELSAKVDSLEARIAELEG